MCHELGHVVMYRAIKDHSWLADDAAEAWAHYFGSRIVDDVYAAEGETIWWQPYDYRPEGMARLTDDEPAARAWMELVGLIGEKKMPALFAAWGKAKIPPADPSPTLLAAVKEVAPQNLAKIEPWWKANESLIVHARPASNFVPSTAPAKPGKPTELALDDGKSAGRKSIAGSGHAVAFEAPADGSRLSAVKVFGSRYGAQQPPAEDFHVYLCDGDGKQIKDFPFAYKTFLRGGERWVTLKLPEATEVPKNFIVCVVFNPTATKGVFVHHDAKPDGDSRTGLPGELNDAFDKGDWMIRAIVEAPAAK
jgi:RNA polymerase sigma-70 factor (ECF subfamily)